MNLRWLPLLAWPCLPLGCSSPSPRAVATSASSVKDSAPAPLASVSASADGEESAVADAAVAASASASASAVASAAPPPDPEKLPFDLAPVALGAAPGATVLAPPRPWLDVAVERGLGAQAFVFYAAKVVSVGPRASVLETRAGVRATLPNAVLVPMEPSGSAVAGDTVLTAWSSGSGLQRAVVVAGGEPARPRVRYLDLPASVPEAAREEQLSVGSFLPIRTAGAVGGTLACKDRSADRAQRWTVLRQLAERQLALSHAGKLAIVLGCTALEPRPQLTRGQRVLVPSVGGYREADVDEVEAALGTVKVRVKVGKKKLEERHALLDVMPAG